MVQLNDELAELHAAHLPTRGSTRRAEGLALQLEAAEQALADERRRADKAEAQAQS